MRRPPTKRSLTCPWCSARVPDGRQATCGDAEGMTPWDQAYRDPVFAKLDAALGHSKWRGQSDPHVGDVSRAKSALAEIGRSL
jgi:hypothetical protein